MGFRKGKRFRGITFFGQNFDTLGAILLTYINENNSITSMQFFLSFFAFITDEEHSNEMSIGEKH